MSTRIISTLLCVVVFTGSEPVGRLTTTKPPFIPDTRRILNGKEVGETRPYMVYLRPSQQADSQFTSTKWLCGGVIIHARYILTSAACIEDVKNFYVVSGTNLWIPPQEESECIKYGAKKAVWKCVPKDYYFDGAEFDNFRWMSGDIAVVKVEDDFNFVKRTRGCEYIPKMIAFNNVSEEYEKANTMGSTAGWGTVRRFGDPETARTSENSIELLETDVQLMSKKSCKKRWEPRYHSIIDHNMLCTKDDQDGSQMSAACIERGVNCKELEYSGEEDDEKEKRLRTNSRRVLDPSGLELHGSKHHQNSTRRFKVPSGGFCENDHGGPLVVGHGTTSIVVGVVSACMTREVTQKCFGPYLYTSVYHHRNLISCAIDKDIGSSEKCRRGFGVEKTFRNGISEVTFDWESLPNIHHGVNILDRLAAPSLD